MKEKLVIVTNFQEELESIIRGAGISENWVHFFTGFILLIGLLLVCWLALLLTKRVGVNLLKNLFLRTANKWDDILIEHKVLENLAHLVPLIILKALTPLLFDGFPDMIRLILKVSDAYMVLVIAWVFLALLRGGEASLSARETFRDKPLASYFQLARLVLYIATGIILMSILMARSPIYFLSAFGAMTAIILLIFKDTILGLVASVQISSNDMVRVGDWVEMPKFNADGDVTAINLNTVKIRNFDNTVTTVPTYYFITDSFKNWRGMQESGGRRIKRSISINLRTVKFVDDDLLNRLKGIDLISKHVTERQLAIMEHNAQKKVNVSELINGRRMTNIGVFRHYVEAYLENHPGIRKDSTLMVRQLKPDGEGLPIEIYCFTNTTAWLQYEEIQSDIFDHLLAAVNRFDLELFQSPGGSDIAGALQAFAHGTNGQKGQIR